MEDKIKRLEEENARLREALDRIREHLQAIDHIMQGLSEVDKTHLEMSGKGSGSHRCARTSTTWNYWVSGL